MPVDSICGTLHKETARAIMNCQIRYYLLQGLLNCVLQTLYINSHALELLPVLTASVVTIGKKFLQCF